LDISKAFAAWMAADEYREEYFASPEDLQLKMQAEFPGYVAELLRTGLTSAEVTDNCVVALFGVGSLFGFARLSHILQMVEADIRGRLVVFFPGHLERSNYRLLDARDGWNYMAVPITLHGDGEVL
jgi:hypothetical protein